MADIDRLIGFMAIMQVPFMNDPDALAYIEEVKTVLKQAKARESGWISVEDRLPETMTDVLLKFTSNMAVGYIGCDGWWVASGGNWYTRVMEDVDEMPQFWMPLPEPPMAGPVDGAPHVVPLDELITGAGVGYEENWLKGEDGEEDSFEVNRCAWCNGGVVLNDAEYVSRAALERLYNKPYGLRVWSREPSAEQRERTPWAG